MPTLSDKSRSRLITCEIDLQRLVFEVIKDMDITVLAGHRGKYLQDMAVATGKSQSPWPNSKHNTKPSLAVDIAPYPIDWDNIKAFYYMGGYVKGIAERLGISIRWGGCWANDNRIVEQRFNDLSHFELIKI